MRGLDTAIGAVVTQLVMAAVLVAAAATIGAAQPGGEPQLGWGRYRRLR